MPDTQVPVAPPVQLTAAGFLTIVTELDAELPMLQSLLQEAVDNPGLVSMITAFVPGLAPFIHQLPQIQQWLSFFQSLEKAFLAAIPSSSPAS